MPGRTSQQVLVFMKVAYPTARNPFMRLTSQRARKGIQRDLLALFEAIDPVCAGLVMDELAPITLEDVKDWFVRNRIYDSEEIQDRLAESVLEGAQHRGLSAVETALEVIHTRFVTEQATGRGDLA